MLTKKKFLFFVLFLQISFSTFAEKEDFLVKDFFSFQDKLSRNIYSFIDKNGNLVAYPDSIKDIKEDRITTLKKGLNFLDLRFLEKANLSKFFQKESWQYLKEHSCAYNSWTQLYQQVNCQSVIFAIFDKMGIDFIVTSSNAKENYTKSCPNQKNANIFFIDKSIENNLKEKLKIMNDKLAKLPGGVNSEVQYSCKLDNCIDSIPAFPKEIHEIQNLFKKGKSLDPVLASKFFSCDGRFIEDSSPEAYLSKNSNAAEDILKYKQEFHKLKEEYSRLGVNPLKIKDLIARRFINRNDWEKYLNKKMNTKEAIQPADVYSPAPVTWQNWRNVTDNYIDKKIKEKGEVTLDELVKWNGEALVGTLPSYVKISLKNTNNMGSNVTKATALNDLEIENIQNIKIPGPKDKNSEIKWVYAKCVEDLKFPIKLPNENPDCQAYYNWVKAIEDKDEFGKKVVKQMEKGELVDAPYSFYCWPRDTKDGGFRDGQIKKHCGFLEYPPTESSKESFEKIIHNVNESINGKNQSVDPIKTAIDHQIQVVGLHPFNKGNGRTSRWVMDYITLSNDLPPILINDMNVDLSTPEKAYYLKAKRGVHHSLLIMQRCLELYKKAEKSVKLKEALQKSECGIDEF